MEPLTFYHAPNTRSFGTRVLLEELGLPYTLHALNLKAGEHRRPEYLAVNPLGKVPAVLDSTVLVTEQVAITLFLADMQPSARLAPVIGDALRGPYLRWIALYGSAFEPAVIDRSMQRDAGNLSMSPYGSFDTLMDMLEVKLAEGPWLLGSQFSAADVLWGTGLGWTMRFKLAPERPGFLAYVERLQERPAFQKAMQADQALAAEFETSSEPAAG